MFVKEKLLSLDEAQDFIPGGDSSAGGGGDQGWTMDLLRMAVERELTGRQRQCVELYYFQGMTMEGISQELGLNKSTVCRHLQKARGRIRHVMAYAEWARAQIRKSSREE